MAGGFPVGLQTSPVATSVSAATPVLVTSSASANTVGAYSELITSTPRDSTWMIVQIQNSGAATSGIITSTNISFGASGSEVNVVNNLRMQTDSNSSLPGQASCYMFPLVVPAGTRIAANMQSNAAAASTTRMTVQLFDDAFGSITGGGAIDTYGFNSATSGGVVVDPGSTGNTKGAWSRVTASLTNDLAGFFLGFDYGSGSTGSFQYYWTMDVGVGASGSEVVVLPDFQIYGKSITNTKSISPPNTPYFPIQIPAGTRVALRSQVNQSTANTSRWLGVTLYGVRL